MMKIFYLTLLAVLATLATNAQNSIRPNIYLQDMHYYNPASVAIDTGEISQTALYLKYKSVENEDDIWKKPMNIWLSHAGRIRKSNSFYHVSYVHDGYSFFNRNAVYIGFTQQKNWGTASVFSYGGRIVGNFDVINWDKFELPHSQTGNALRFNPDLDLGLAYQYKRFKVGLGIKNILATASKVEGAALLKNHREFNAHLSYQQNLGKWLAITPFLLLANERSTLIDAGVSFSAFSKVKLSYALRVNELKSVITLDVALCKGLSAGLAYDRSSLVSDNNIDFVLRYRR